eukprot:COSAG05_NODE_187_length_14703_cov_123.022186_2_plen_60_part_00
MQYTCNLVHVGKQASASVITGKHEIMRSNLLELLLGVVDNGVGQVAEFFRTESQSCFSS